MFEMKEAMMMMLEYCRCLGECFYFCLLGLILGRQSQPVNNGLQLQRMQLNLLGLATGE